MKWIIKSNGKEIGRVVTNHAMTNEEICECAGIELAITKEDFEGIPENGKYDLDELQIITEINPELDILPLASCMSGGRKERANMESCRVYKSLPADDFMEMAEFVMAKAGLLLTPLIQDTNYTRKVKGQTDEVVKEQFIESVKKLIESNKEHMELDVDIFDSERFYIFTMYQKMDSEKTDWFTEITDNLRDYSEGEIWSDGTEILCRTESAADCLADMLTSLYGTQGEDIVVNTGYYDPEVDKRNNEEDRYTGWWFVSIE